MNKARMLLAVGAVGVIVAGGSAFTDAVSFGSPAAGSVAGYGTETVTGGTVSSVTYNTDPSDGHSITNVTLAMVGDTTGSTVSIGLNGAAPLTSCGTGTFTTVTTYTCPVTGDLASVTALAVSVN